MSADVNSGIAVRPAVPGWSELWRKEDWWAIWIGLGIVAVAYILFAQGDSLKWIAVTPAKWSNFGQLAAHFSANIPRYAAQLGLWLVIFTAATSVLGQRPAQFIPAFLLLYVISLAIFW